MSGKNLLRTGLFWSLVAAMGLVAQALWLNSNRADASPRRLIIIAVIVLSALLVWLQFRFVLSISRAVAGAVLFYGLYLRRTRTS